MKTVICGIYKITNIKNNKIYIGSSINMYERWRKHKEMLLRDGHHSIHLQRAFNKHGLEYFKFEILEECDADYRCIREQFYLDSLLKAQEFIQKTSNFFIKNGYNMNPNSSHEGVPRHVTKDQLLRTRDTAGRDVIYQVEHPSNNIMMEFELIKEASEYNNKALTTITNSIKNNKVLKGCNYYFCWKRDYDINNNATEYRNGCLAKGKNHPKSKKLYVYSRVDRKLYKIFNSINECSIYFNKSMSHISKLIAQKNKFKVGIKLNSTRNFIFSRQSIKLKKNCWEGAVFKVNPETKEIIGLPYSALHFNNEMNLVNNAILNHLDTNNVINGYLFYKTETYYNLINKDIV